MRKKLFLTFLLIVLISFIFNAQWVLAQGRELEIEYPEIEGERPEQVTTQVHK